jgi:hypothetical protein
MMANRPFDGQVLGEVYLFSAAVTELMEHGDDLHEADAREEEQRSG